MHLHVSPWPQDSSSQILAFSPTFFLLSQNYENTQGPTRGTFLPYPSLMSAKCLRLALGCFLWPRRCSTKKFSQQLINGNFIFQEKKELPQILFNFISPDSLPFHFLFDTESMVQMVKEGKLKLICPLRTRPCALQLCTVSTTLFCTPTLRSVFPGSYHCIHIFFNSTTDVSWNQYLYQKVETKRDRALYFSRKKEIHLEKAKPGVFQTIFK